MKAAQIWVVILCALAVVTDAGAQAWNRAPEIGYVYPAGGRQGSVIYVTIGGQFLQSATSARVSGDGVSAKVYEYKGRPPRLNAEQREELVSRLRALRSKRARRLPKAAGLLPSELAGKKDKPPKDAGKKKKSVTLPDHPLLNKLDSLNFGELRFVVNEFLRPNNSKKQPNAQIAETVLVEVTISKDAQPGDREFRLQSERNGLSNPLCFQVGSLPEIEEPHPFDEGASPGEPLTLPVLINGQIMPGDVDRFRFKAMEGQKVVINAQARHLIPFLADAVPGWFQATLALFDSDGKEVAFVDDYEFHPDPVMLFKIPASGVYEMEIRDAIYRGREDFVYRIAVGELPFTTSMFPLGGQAGKRLVSETDGWNLPRKYVSLDTSPDEAPVREAEPSKDARIPTPLVYAVDEMYETEERESNDTLSGAQSIQLSRIINGRISMPGDVDIYRVSVNGGTELVAEVSARRLNSPLDSLLKLLDSRGQLIELNDDRMDKKGYLHRDMGELTHHADSYIQAKLPRAGTYYIQLSDTGQHGGENYAYRLRLSTPRPDFALMVAPCTLNMRAGRAVPLSVYALRKDGFDGEIAVRLKEAPEGFELQGNTIPAGSDGVRMTIIAPSQPPEKPFALQIEGRASIKGKTEARVATPCEDLMQAFLWRHLRPSQQLLVCVSGGRGWQNLPYPTQKSPVKIPVGGSARVRLRSARNMNIQNVEIVLNDPPAGVIVEEASPAEPGLELVLSADSTAKPGEIANLIVEAFTERQRFDKNKKPTGTYRASLGFLPAIPYEIVQQ